MNYSKFFLAPMLALMLAGFLSCEKDAVITQQLTSPPTTVADNRAPNPCFNFRSEGNVDIGCACIPTPLVCPPGMSDFCNFGARTFPVTIGEYNGYMTSVVTNLEAMGNPPTGNGALKLSLIHYFVTEDGTSAFWTEDKAVGSPGSDPYSVIINDVLDIAGGCGDFVGASGKFHNHGLLTFNGGAELCPIFYLNGEEDYVPTGSLSFEVFGRICGPNLD